MLNSCHITSHGANLRYYIIYHAHSRARDAELMSYHITESREPPQHFEETQGKESERKDGDKTYSCKIVSTCTSRRI
jgi:hypothetical protein